MGIMKGEVILNIASEKAWEMYRDNEVISKINPQMLESATYVHGDGSPGSLRLFKLGPVVAKYVKESLEKIERVETGKSVTYSVVGGDLRNLYNPYIVTFSFTPLHINNEKEQQCVAEWKVEFEGVNPETPPPNQARDAALAFLRCFDNFQFS